MQTVLDNLNSFSGWVFSSSGASAYDYNEFPEFVAGNLDKSLILKFSEKDAWAEKDLGSVDTSNYDELVIWNSSNTLGNSRYETKDDFVYTIDLGNGNEFYLPARSSLTWVKISLSGISEITKLKVRSLHDNTDHLVLNYAVLVKDQLPYDLFVGIKGELEYIRDEFYSPRVVGTASGVAGESYIDFDSFPEQVMRNSYIKIVGTDSEKHKITRVDGLRFYTEKPLANSYTSNNVYPEFPVYFGATQKEILLPGIAIWGFPTEKENVATELDLDLDSWRVDDDTVKGRQRGGSVLWDILIDVEAKENWEFIEEMAGIVRKFITRKKVWVNGRKLEVFQTGPAQEIFPTEAYDIIPKIQFSVNIHLIEEAYLEDTIPSTKNTNVKTFIEE